MGTGIDIVLEDEAKLRGVLARTEASAVGSLVELDLQVLASAVRVSVVESAAGRRNGIEGGKGGEV